MERLVVVTPSLRYVEAGDGAQIPYYEAGAGEPYVYLGFPFISHLTARLQLPGEVVLHERLKDRVRMVGLELRGTGLSRAEGLDLSVDARANDIWTVAQHLALPPFTLHAGWHACSTAIHFAATHPDAVRSLILVGPYADGRSIYRDAASGLRGVRLVVEADVEFGYRTALQGMGVSADDLDLYVEVSLQTVDADAYPRIADALEATDVSAELPRVACPTLVVALADQVILRSALSQQVAAALPDARLALVGAEFFSPAIVSSIEEFLDDLGIGVESPARAHPSGDLRTILFTDVENSTDLVVQHGDAKYRELLADHERLVREALAEHSGNEIKTIGDSFMCWFGSASSALDAAHAMQRKITDHYGDGLRIRIGIHAGEPIQEADGDLYGTSVVRASRIMGQADGGQILVSQVVTDLVEGKGYLFSDAGEFALKGYERAVHLFDVAWEAK